MASTYGPEPIPETWVERLADGLKGLSSDLTALGVEHSTTVTVSLPVDVDTAGNVTVALGATDASSPAGQLLQHVVSTYTAAQGAAYLRYRRQVDASWADYLLAVKAAEQQYDSAMSQAARDYEIGVNRIG